MTGCEDCLRNDLYCVWWGVKRYSIQFNRPIVRLAARPIIANICMASHTRIFSPINIIFHPGGCIVVWCTLFSVHTTLRINYLSQG